MSHVIERFSQIIGDIEQAEMMIPIDIKSSLGSETINLACKIVEIDAIRENTRAIEGLQGS
jgi:hypothetical protein